MSHEKLKEILSRRLNLKDPQFCLEGRGRISGSLVSATFTGTWTDNTSSSPYFSLNNGNDSVRYRTAAGSASVARNFIAIAYACSALA